MKLTPAQERELAAWYRDGARPRPMTITKYRRMHLMGGNDWLNDEGRRLAQTLAEQANLNDSARD